MKVRNIMNKIIPFTKVITLNERFDEIKKIALDDTLMLEDSYLIKGDLIVRGCYKTEEKEENFTYPMPVEIAIDSKYDTSKCSINIDDFYYEIINEQSIRVKIDLMLDDLYYKEEKEEKTELVLEDNRNNYEDELKEEYDFKEEVFNNKILNNQDVFNADVLNNNSSNINEAGNVKEVNNGNNNINDLFKETSDDMEYSIYRVYTVMENDTLEYIMDKYQVDRETLAAFNNLDNLQMGMKLIIPSVDE